MYSPFCDNPDCPLHKRMALRDAHDMRLSVADLRLSAADLKFTSNTKGPVKYETYLFTRKLMSFWPDDWDHPLKAWVCNECAEDPDQIRKAFKL